MQQEKLDNTKIGNNQLNSTSNLVKILKAKKEDFELAIFFMEFIKKSAFFCLYISISVVAIKILFYLLSIDAQDVFLNSIISIHGLTAIAVATVLFFSIFSVNYFAPSILIMLSSDLFKTKRALPAQVLTHLNYANLTNVVIFIILFIKSLLLKEDEISVNLFFIINIFRGFQYEVRHFLTN